ncbi:MAG: HEAT repeat domain-containing protein, partial [Bryobacterales bacterium]|nr:HEAT repeat domain-containing protein [Bryobacterales bacterium]
PDTSTLFADKLTLPTGITRWKKGVLVTDAPNLWYLEDTNNDGKADIKKPILTGFAFTNPQHTVNSPTYGLDNWIYLAHEGFATAIVYADKFGDHGTDIRFADRPTPTVKNERRNVRFKPDTFQLETTSSTSQYGLGFDDYGRLLTVNNSNHARQEMLAARYLARNPHLLAASSMQDTSDHGAAAQVFFTVKSPRFELLSGAGIFTSACSITWFEGGTLVAEPVHSLVHRDLWTPSGPTYIAKRAQPNTEFLSSSDNWFRPVNFYIGPNPGIYVIDYYRKMIEHPEWMSKDAGEGKDLYDGKDKGRIYLLSPANAPAVTTALPKLSNATNDQLIANLEKPNIWWRRNSQRLLVDRNDANTIAPLQKLARNGKSPLGRLHALWTLEGLNKLESDTLLAALADPEPGVRENAIILAESRLTDATLTARLLTMANDTDPRVRFQLLATLGYLQTPAAAKVRKQLLDRDSEDRWMQMAALSAGSDEALPALTEATRAPGNATPGRTNYLQQLGAIIGARGNPAETNKVLTLATSHQAAWWRAPVLDGLATGIRSRKATLSPNPLLLRLYDDTDAPVSRAALHLLELSGLPPNSAALLVKAVATAKDRTQPAGRRANAIALTALSTNPQPPAFYETQTAPSEPEEVQLAAIRALAKQKGQEPARFFLTHWRAMTPAIRSEAATAFLTDQQRFTMLLNAIEEGAVQPWSLPLRMRVQMQMNRDPALREKARTLLAGNAGEREKIYQRYLAVIDKQPGDPTKGKATFDNICSKCHKLNGKGSEVGPDLATVRNRTAEALLSDILLPSRSIAQMYEAYVVETQSGQILEGVIGEQTSTTITLVHEQQKKDVIPRASIKQMYVSNLSAMPEDLDKEITPQQAADLIAYLKKP